MVRGQVAERLPRSLRRATLRELRKFRTHRLMSERWFIFVRRFGGSLFGGARGLPLSVFAVCVGGLFVPGPSWMKVIAEGSDASAFLGQLWQVVAASAGLAIAVVFFALQTLASSGRTGVRDAGLLNQFQLVVYLGVSSLFVIGLDLLGIGYAAPGGWAAAWATVVSAAAILTVAVLFAGTLSMMIPGRLLQRRLRTIRYMASVAVEDDAYQRVALNLLEQMAESADYAWSPFGSNNSSIASSTRPGVVTDINLKRLAKLSAAAQMEGAMPVTLVAYIGRPVEVGTALIFGNASNSDLRGRAARVVRTSSRKPDPGRAGIDNLVDELHAEAIQAIRDARLTDFKDIARAQEAVVLAVPAAWQARFGQRFTSGLASGLFPIQIGPVEQMSRNFYEQARATLGTQIRELALDVAYQPLHIASEALRLDADGLAAEMLRTAGSIARLPTRDETSSLLRDHAWSNFISTMRYTVEPLVEDKSLADDKRIWAADLVVRCIEIVARIGHHAIASRDAAYFAEVDRAWSHVHEFWLEDTAARYQPESIDKALATKIKNYRDAAQRAVAVWLIWELLRNPQDGELAGMFGALRLRNTPIAKAISSAATPELPERFELLDDWIMGELPTGEVHTIDTTTPLLSGLALLLVANSRDAVQRLEPNRFLLDRRAEFIAAIDFVATKEFVPRLLGLTDDESNSAISNAKDAVSNAADRQEADDDLRLRLSRITNETRAKFASQVRAAWEKQHENSLRALLEYAGLQVVTEHDAPPPLQIRTRPRLENKFWAVDDRGTFGFQHIAEDGGRALTSGESRQFWAELGVPDRDSDESEFDAANQPEFSEVNAQVDAAISALRARGYQPSLLLHGLNYAALTALTVEPLSPYDQSVGPNGIRGRHNAVLVAQAPGIPSDEIVVVDVARWAQLHEWVSDAGPVQASLIDFDAESAAAYLTENPHLFTEKETEDERVFELQRRILIEMSAAVSVEVLDQDAVHLITPSHPAAPS
jgi:hypothetical protein